MEMAPTDATRAVHLHSGGCSLLIDLTKGGVPTVVHWGADLGRLRSSDVAAIRESTRSQRIPNGLLDPAPVGVVPEGGSGWPGRPGLRGSRGGRQWSPRFRLVTATVDGSPVQSVLDTGPAVLETTLADEEGGLGLTVELEMLGSGLVRARGTLTNRGDRYAVDDLVLTLPVPPHADELLDFTGRWGMERVPQRSAFTVGAHVRENRRGRTGADAATVLHACVPGAGFADGEAWGVHTAWSGNHTHYAERTHVGSRVLGGGELLQPGEVVLDRGEEYRTPWVYGAYGHGLDAVAHRFHRYLRSRDGHVDHVRPVTLNVWEAVYFDHDLDRLLELARAAADVGVERYVLDDGWFGARRSARAGLGDWVVSDEAWPQGLHPLVDEVHRQGMQFGLWVEPEMVNPDSHVAREHPEWVMSARSTWPVESRHQQVIDLSNPACYDHVLGQLLAILDEYDIAYLKWDHNRDLVEAGSPVDEGRPAVHRQTTAVYRLLDTIRERHPGLEIESCSSGGGRVDLGVLERTDRVWVSDCIDPLERQRALRWTAQLIPPELMGSHVASERSHTTGRRHALAFRAATAVFGHLGVEWDLTRASPGARHDLAAWIGAYKEHRELLLTGDIVRGPDPSEAIWVHGVVSPEKSAAMYAVVSMTWSLEAPPAPVRLTGLAPERHYRVTPVLPTGTPAGMTLPAWWPSDHEDIGSAHRSARGPRDVPADEAARGPVLTGRVLAAVGIRPPTMRPEQAVLLHVVAEG